MIQIIHNKSFWISVSVIKIIFTILEVAPDTLNHTLSNMGWSSELWCQGRIADLLQPTAFFTSKLYKCTKILINAYFNDKDLLMVQSYHNFMG